MQCKKYQDFMREYQYYKEKFLLEYRKTGKRFRDHYFHPYMNIKENEIEFDPNEIEWRRIDEVYKAPLFDEKLISIDYVQQGIIPNCCFISAISRIAKQPELVKRLFDTTADTILGKEPNSINIKCGAVVIFFNAFGRSTPVLIDTKVPFYKGSKNLVCSSPTSEKVSPWFCLVEKAYAKLFGSYSNIKGETFVCSIYSLFGYQPLMKTISDLRKFKKTPFQRLVEYKKQGAVMDCSIQDFQNDDILESVGLVSYHSYLLVKLIEYKGRRFFKLRNPWGNFVWNGEWSNDSPLWTEEMKRALKISNIKKDDGSFWMIEKDFLRYFSHFEISRPIPNDWYSKSFTLEMWPGNWDGLEPDDANAHIEKRPNYAIKIKPKNFDRKKVSLFFLIERRSYFRKEVKFIEEKPSTFYILLVFSNGKKLTQNVIQESNGTYFVIEDKFQYFRFDMDDPSQILTVALQRVEKRKEFDQCSIRVTCKYDFDVYSIDKPNDLIEENNNKGKLFVSQTGVIKVASKGDSNSGMQMQKLMKNKDMNKNKDDNIRKDMNKNKDDNIRKDKNKNKDDNIRKDMNKNKDDNIRKDMNKNKDDNNLKDWNKKKQIGPKKDQNKDDNDYHLPQIRQKKAHPKNDNGMPVNGKEIRINDIKDVYKVKLKEFYVDFDSEKLNDQYSILSEEQDPMREKERRKK